MPETTQEISRSTNPDRLLVHIPGLDSSSARTMAYEAQQLARMQAPKMSGAGAKSIYAVWGRDFIGLRAGMRYMWYQERGINPFTMRSLAGKTIPMWIDDPTGTERQKNPKAKTRTTASGKVQVLIFRRAARIGEMKTKKRRNKVTKQWDEVQVPKHWPGAPGRIAKREASQPLTTPGRTPGAVAKGNIGVWWRHPGLAPRDFMNYALTSVTKRHGYPIQNIIAADRGWHP